MVIVAWTIVIALWIVAFLGLVYPIIPSAVFMFLGFIAYGLFISFDSMNGWFWLIQLLLLVLLFVADTLSNLVGVKKFGGTKAGMWGSTIGLLVGPFVIPFAGIILGPFLGAIIGEMIVSRTSFKTSIKVGIGSLVGFLTSILTKGFLMIVMIAVFLIFLV